MMIVMQEGATEAQIQAVVDRIAEAGARAHLSRGEFVTVIGAIGDDRELVAQLDLLGEPGVEKVVPILKPYKIVSREFRHGDRVVDVAGRRFGGGAFGLIAGPCTVEDREQTLSTARAVKAAGASLLRGGAYKPRTSPYTFQGLGKPALEILAEAREETGLPVVTEVMDLRQLEDVLEVADVIQLGARNMQNFDLLREVGRTDRPVLLKKGLANTIEEWLLSAEYVAKEGNDQIILCERGIRTFETATRSTLDISAVPVAKQLSCLPVIVDPSHAAGRRDLILPMARAAVVAGADGLIVEVHPAPEHALCDGPQQIRSDTFAAWVADVKRCVDLMGLVMTGGEPVPAAV
ncbi:MAG: 3-deoxy-7-phosphoheptulonate synthase [Thermoleophilia bacterium]|jgi:3-deoxy-7-phosphoheptulonate synthase|nr:3-deoxy-7-phosphoheptulonate synthase [Thermoleophilia bacterium]